MNSPFCSYDFYTSPGPIESGSPIGYFDHFRAEMYRTNQMQGLACHESWPAS